MLSRGSDNRFSEIVDADIEIEDLFRLWREVRLSSRGFISGGSLVILRKVTASQRDRASEIKCRPAGMTEQRKAVPEKSVVSACPGDRRVLHADPLPKDSLYCADAVSAPKA